MYSNLYQKIDCEQGAIRAVRYNFNGDYCVTCGSNKTLKLWNPKKALKLQIFHGHNNDVLDAKCSVDSSTICSGGNDRYVYLWDVSTAKPIRMFREHIAPINCVAFNEESTLIISGSVDCSVRIFDCKSKSRESIQVLNEAKNSVTSVLTNDHQLITSSLDGKVRIYDIRKGELSIENCHSSIVCLSETQDKQCLLAACLDNTLRLLDKKNGQFLAEYRGHSNKNYRIDCAFNKNDSILISGSEDGKIYYWNLLDSKLIGSVKNDNKLVIQSLSTNVNKDELLTASENFIYLWN